jgi:hypothetical protein
MRLHEEFQGSYAETRVSIGERLKCRFNFGGSSSNTNTAFRRAGTTQQKKSHVIPGDLSSLISTGSYRSTSVDPVVGGKELSFLSGLFDRNNAQVPGQSILEAIQGITPEVFQGSSALQGMQARNPYSTDYETAMQALYDRQYDKARASAISGPQNVRGAQDRQGLELADLGSQMAQGRFAATTDQQNREAGVVQQATQIFNAIEGMRRGSQMQAQGQQQQGQHLQTQETLGASGALQGRHSANAANIQLASELLGDEVATNTESITGRGQQSGSASNWGVNVLGGCCFIFLESMNGKLPEFVRKGRDTYCTKERRDGYVATANRIVPLMRKSRFARWLTNTLMVRPFLAVGRWHFKEPDAAKGAFLLVPLCLAWFKTWDVIGSFKKGVVYGGH